MLLARARSLRRDRGRAAAGGVRVVRARRRAEHLGERVPGAARRGYRDRAARRSSAARTQLGLRHRPGGDGARSTARATSACTSTSRFYDELARRFGAPGDFAQAYVIAHEIGHHVQHLLGTTAACSGAQRASARANELSVRLELQADCYAGVWAHAREQRELLEAGDIDEALARPPRDRRRPLQQQSAGTRAARDASRTARSEQRVRWFKRGFETGDARRLRHVRIARALSDSLFCSRAEARASTGVSPRSAAATPDSSTDPSQGVARRKLEWAIVPTRRVPRCSEPGCARFCVFHARRGFRRHWLGRAARRQRGRRLSTGIGCRGALAPCAALGRRAGRAERSAGRARGPFQRPGTGACAD